MSVGIRYRNLLIALQNKAMNNQRLKEEKINNRVFFIDDEDDPILPDGISFDVPFVGLLDPGIEPEQLGSGQYEMDFQISGVLFYKKHDRDPQQSILGQRGILALWEILMYELAVKLDRNDFAGTVLADQVIEVFFTSAGGARRVKSPAHPMLMKKPFTLEFQMVQEVEV
jgi:hypothetical protein